MSYTFHQSHQQIMILCEVPWATRSSDVELHLAPDSIVAGIKGATPLLKGRLFAPIVPASSTWYLERRPGERRSGRPTTRSSSSSQSNGGNAQASERSPPRRSASPSSASSFDLVAPSQASSLASFATGVHDGGRSGPTSESSSSFDSSGDWTRGGATSDEGELVGHLSPEQPPSSPSVSHMSHSGFLPARYDSATDNGSSAPPSLEASSILQPPSEESANTFSTTSTGSIPQSQSSTDSPRTHEMAAGAPPLTRLLTLHLVKAAPKIWEHLVIVDGIDGLEAAPGVPDMDATSLASLASELVHRGFDARERAFNVLLHARSIDHHSLASHLLLLHFFAPRILAPSGAAETTINPSHIFRLGGTQELALFYLSTARIYLKGPMPPPPPHHRFSTGPALRPTAAHRIEVARSLLTRAVLADPRVVVNDPELKSLAREMGLRRGKRGGVWRRVSSKGRGRGRGGAGCAKDLLRVYGVYLLGGAVLAGAVAVGTFWWRRRAPSSVPSLHDFREGVAASAQG